MQARAGCVVASSEIRDGGIVDAAVLLRVHERVDQGHSGEADRKTLGGLDFGLGLLGGPLLFDRQAVFGIGRDTRMEFLS